MSGRPKQKAYHYDNNGKFIKEYSCMNEIRQEYYSSDSGKRPLFRTNARNQDGSYKIVEKDYIQLPDNTFVTKSRVGRIGIKDIKRRINNPFLGIEERTIEAYNLDNKIVATFKGLKIAANLTNIPYGTIVSQLEKGQGKFSDRGLIFKYQDGQN